MKQTQYDAVLLAGDTGASRSIAGINKVFLEIEGIPLFLHVLEALEKAQRISRICLIGPRQQLLQALERHDLKLEHKKEVIILEQTESLFSNAWKAFLALNPDLEKTALSPSPLDAPRTVFYVPGDVPLITPFEIDTFIAQCPTEHYDYCAGLTSAEDLSFFYPGKGTPGIKTSYFHIYEGRYRQNNLHLLKPLKVGNRHYVQKVYDYRYQKDIRNIMKLAAEFLKVHVGLKGFWCYGLLHWHQLLSRLHLNFLTLPTRPLLPLSFIEQCISKVLNTRFVTVISPTVGAALDIDNEKDYCTMCTMFSRWKHAIRQKEEAWKKVMSVLPGKQLSRHHAA